MLTAEKARKLWYYNPDTGEFVNKVNRSRNAGKGKLAGYIHPTGYKFIKFKYKAFSAHRLAWLIMTGKWPTNIDHINGNPSDNRWNNLRECTAAQNAHNSKIRKNNNSGFKGVCWHKSKKWHVRIGINNKRIYIGLFDTKEEAYEAYIKASKQYHGEYGKYV